MMPENSQGTQPTKKKGLTATHIILIIGFVVVIGVAIWAVLFLNKKDDVAAIPEIPGVITEQNLAEVEEDLNADIEKSQFQLLMNTKWSFPSGTSASTDAVVGNAAGNSYPFYFTLKLADSGQQIYKSGLIPIGKKLKNITLDEPLSAGKYNAICQYHLIDDKGVEVESTLGFQVQLTVES